MKSKIETKVKRGQNSWQFIWSFFGILLGLIIAIILYLPFSRVFNLIFLFIALVSLVYLCLLNGWGQNKIIELKIWIEDRSKSTELNIKAIIAIVAIVIIALLGFYKYEKNKSDSLVKLNNLTISDSISPLSSNIESLLTQYYSLNKSDDRKKFIQDYIDSKMHGTGNLLNIKKRKYENIKNTEFVEIQIDVQGDIIVCNEIVDEELNEKLGPFNIGDEIVFTGVLSGYYYDYLSGLYTPEWKLNSCKF